MRVATEISEHLCRPAKRPLRVDDPRRGPERREERGEPAGLGERRGAAGEGELPLGERAVQPRQILGTEHDRQGLDRKQKCRAPADPARAIARQGAARDETMDVQMLRERLAPRVEDRGDADRAAEVSGIVTEGEQRVGRRAKEERVDDPGIPLRECIQRMRQGEDDVEVRDREEVRAAGVDPAPTRLRLTLRTVAIATGIEREAGCPAVVTRLPTPAQQGGAARRDREQGSSLDVREPMRAAIGVAMDTHDVAERETRRRDRRRRAGGDGTHRLGLREVEPIQ